MSVSAFTALSCPLDGTPLGRQSNTFSCLHGHSFDVARQGYVNLLPVQKKRSLDPGDSKEMVAARKQFLNTGVYQPISQAINRLVLSGLPNLASILDAGSGEGYYLRQLVDQIPASNTLSVLGVDISKWAVLSAAQQDNRLAWVVASNANLPVLAQQADWVLCIFGFPVLTEFSRVLKQGGKLLMVDAGPKHLIELRELIYPMIKPQKPVAANALLGFVLTHAENLSFTITLNGTQQIADLLAMTPHLYRASAEGLAKASALTKLTTTVDVRLNVFEKVELDV
jgi:23S rRNA (guanine745-N1)-methyltransferase